MFCLTALSVFGLAGCQNTSGNKEEGTILTTVGQSATEDSETGNVYSDETERAGKAAGADGTDEADATGADKADGSDRMRTDVIHTVGVDIDGNQLQHLTNDPDAPEVYFTPDISSEGLLALYHSLGWNPEGRTGIKISTGESERSNHLEPSLIADLVREADGTIVECMTAYGGNRAEIAMAKQVAEDRGYTAIAPFDLMDEDGETEIPLAGGVRVDKAIIGSHIDDYGSFIVLSHFKGHAMAGFGGAIKNVATGMSSKHGKVYVHTAGERTEGSIFYSSQDAWLEALPETVKAVSDHMGDGNMVYISVMNRLSMDCDCDGNPEKPKIGDIGILASTDPVALDKACVDLIYKQKKSRRKSFVRRIEEQNGVLTLSYAEEIGLGTQSYKWERTLEDTSQCYLAISDGVDEYSQMIPVYVFTMLHIYEEAGSDGVFHWEEMESSILDIETGKWIE